jgi:hypothetical protein
MNFDSLDRKELLALRRQINDRLAEIAENKHAAVVSAGISVPPGWGERKLCSSEDPCTGLVCEFEAGHGCELHSNGSHAWR